MKALEIFHIDILRAKVLIYEATKNNLLLFHFGYDNLLIDARYFSKRDGNNGFQPIAFIPYFIPQWWQHITIRNLVLDEDMILLHQQEKFLQQKLPAKNWQTAHKLPTSMEIYCKAVYDLKPLYRNEIHFIAKVRSLNKFNSILCYKISV